MTGRELRNQLPGVPSITSPSRHSGKAYFFFKVPPALAFFTVIVTGCVQ